MIKGKKTKKRGREYQLRYPKVCRMMPSTDLLVMAMWRCINVESYPSNWLKAPFLRIGIQRSFENKAKISTRLSFDFPVLAYTQSSTIGFVNRSFSPCLSKLVTMLKKRTAAFCTLPKSVKVKIE